MKAICVDDEERVLDQTVYICKKNENIEDVTGFTRAQEVLEYLKKGTKPDIAFLDIDMPDMNGITLAAKIKKLCPDIVIIFVTGYSEYAVKAFEVHAQGYLLKPISKEKLDKEIEFALSYIQSNLSAVKNEYPHIFARTFGNFEMMVDGSPMTFSRAKAKELLAYLVDRQGSYVTRAEAFAALYEDEDYTRNMQKQFDVIIRSMKQALRDGEISEVFEQQRGAMRICPEKFSCDLYRFVEGDPDAVNSFRGEYMNSYTWAEITEGLLSRDFY